jgi:hypothetical protein
VAPLEQALLGRTRRATRDGCGARERLQLRAHLAEGVTAQVLQVDRHAFGHTLLPVGEEGHVRIGLQQTRDETWQVSACDLRLVGSPVIVRSDREADLLCGEELHGVKQSHLLGIQCQH